MDTKTEQKPQQMMAQPQKEHRWLQKFVGEWTYEGEATMGPDQPVSKFSGSEKVRALGDLWVIGESKGPMPEGGTGEMVMTIGFDPQRKRFVGSFLGTMAANMWVYEGLLDASEKVLTLNTEGPAMTDPSRTAKYKDVVEFKSDDHRVLTSQAQGDDGKWQTIMTSHYHKR